MTLHFTLHVNGHSIRHTVAIQRIWPKRPVPADRTVCLYQVDVFDPPGVSPTRTRNSTEVRHRYGDGPMELVRKALNAIKEAE